MAAPAFVLLHSPLVGPGSWTKVATQLSQQGFDTVVPRLSGAFDEGAPYYPKLVRHVVDAVRIAVPAGDLVVVGHSGAGALIPAITREIPAAGAIFVDALLPHPGKAWFDTAPADLKAHLLSLAKDGRVPRWHEWWPQGAIAKLLGDETITENFISGLCELPLAYFEEAAPDVRLPTMIGCAYLQLSKAARADADAAAAMGWPVLQRPAHHLAMLVDPADVAADLVMLSATIGVGVQ